MPKATEDKKKIKGVSIEIYNGDHPPPHFHARYQKDNVLIDIQKGSVLRGNLPNKKLKVAMDFLEENRDDLLELFYEQNPSLRP